MCSLGCGMTGIGLIALLWAKEFEDSYHFYLQPTEVEKTKTFDPHTGKIKTN